MEEQGGGEDLQLIPIHDLGIRWVSGERHAPAGIYPRETTPCTNCTGGWVSLRAGLEKEIRENILSPLPGI
jgi:hypothetical protein